MKMREFGSTGLKVSAIGFGGGAISGAAGGYSFGDISEDDAIALLRHALDLGINLFDTAPIYGFGESERRIGKAFRQDRDRVFIVSKSGVTWHENQRVNMTNDPKVAQKMLEQSLRDLGTDYIDLYMIHWPDKNVDIRRPMEILAKAQHEQKIRFIGLSNTYPDDYERAKEIAPVDALQSEYNVFVSYPETDLWPIIQRDQCAFMSWGTLDKGILTGRVSEDRKYDASDARSRAPWWKSADRSWKYRALEEINPLLKSSGFSPLELCLGWVLRQPKAIALCGARNQSQLQGLVDASHHLPEEGLLADIAEIVDRYRP
jgi:aryl-alcohol dehydrogenase-like predicted oxidoreductase